MKPIKKFTVESSPVKINLAIYKSEDYEKKFNDLTTNGHCVYDYATTISISLCAPTTKEIITHELLHAFIFKALGYTPIHRQIDFEELIAHAIGIHFDEMLKIRNEAWRRFKSVK